MKTPTRVRSTANFLRFLAISQIVAFAIVFVPEAWIASLHGWLGLGQMPDAVFLRYVLRGAAWCQGAFGVLFWVMASDVVRHRPLVITTAVIYLVAAPTFYFMNAIAGLPRWWCVWDFTVCFLAGGILLALCVWPSRVSPILPSSAHLSAGN
jgi:hypothetical protein